MIEWMLWPFVSFFIAAGIFIFLRGLELVISVFHQHEYLVYFLPIAGVLVYFLEKIPAVHNLGDSELILEEIATPRKEISWRLAPWICILTWWSHLFGASAGRESTAIQMGASIAESTGSLSAKIFKQIHVHRPLLLRMGLAGGFSVAFAAPLAGLIFALEHPRHIHRGIVFEVPLIAATSWLSFVLGHLLGLETHMFPNPSLNISAVSIWSYILVSMGLAFFAIFYQNLAVSLKLLFSRWPRWMSFAIGGGLVAGAAWCLNSVEWHSTGDQLFPRAFAGSVDFWEGPLKLVLTAITQASGFRGGEVVPLMASGTLIGNSLAAIGGLPVGLIATTGLVVIFSLRLHCPLAGLVFLLERVNPESFFAGILPVLLAGLFSKILASRGQILKKRSTV